MTEVVLWFVLSFVLVVAELITGTFYVLMIAIAFAAGGVIAWLGGDYWFQLVGAAVVGSVSTLVLRRSHLGKASRHADPATDAEQTFDIGQPVAVDLWRPDGTTRVQYRGTQWDAVLADGESPSTGRHYICAVRGARLTLSTRPA